MVPARPQLLKFTPKNHQEVESHAIPVRLGKDPGRSRSLAGRYEDARELRVRVAVGVEPELWPKIRVPIGEGIAGRVAWPSYCPPEVTLMHTESVFRLLTLVE